MTLNTLRAVLDNFSDIIVGVEDKTVGTARKIRINIKDGSFADVWRSDSGRYSYHWERKHVNGSIYRFNNAPHHKDIRTFPDHLHYGNEDNVIDSSMGTTDFESALAQVLVFIRQMLAS